MGSCELGYGALEDQRGVIPTSCYIYQVVAQPDMAEEESWWPLVKLHDEKSGPLPSELGTCRV